jgi:hypothetical protein
MIAREVADRVQAMNVRKESANRLYEALHGKDSNIVWTFSVLRREPTSRPTEVSKKLPEFHYDCRKPLMASSICLRATIFQNLEGPL